jgi:hypothetical protein
MNTPKPHVLKAFSEAGLTENIVWYTTCAALVNGRYIAFYGSHEGWQIGKSVKPQGRIVVTKEQAVAWALRGEWPTGGTDPKQGYRVDENGVEKGREEKAETPVVPASSLDKTQIDPAQLLRVLALLGVPADAAMALINKA